MRSQSILHYLVTFDHQILHLHINREVSFFLHNYMYTYNYVYDTKHSIFNLSHALIIAILYIL